jgi:hypothetical protein
MRVECLFFLLGVEGLYLEFRVYTYSSYGWLLAALSPPVFDEGRLISIFKMNTTPLPNSSESLPTSQHYRGSVLILQVSVKVQPIRSTQVWKVKVHPKRPLEIWSVKDQQ